MRVYDAAAVQKDLLETSLLLTSLRPIILETRLFTAGSVSRPFTVTPYVPFVPTAAAVFSLSTMEKDIFIPQPFLPLEDKTLATTCVVLSRDRRTQQRKNEPQRSKIDKDRAVACFSHMTTTEASCSELSTPNSNESSLSEGLGLKGASQRTERNFCELNSSKTGGERAFASSPHRITTTKKENPAESPPVQRGNLPTSSADNGISTRARRSVENLNELCSSKNDGEGIIPGLSHTSPFNMKGKLNHSQQTLPHDNPPQGHENTVAAHARCLIVNLNERMCSKFDGEQVFFCPPQCPIHGCFSKNLGFSKGIHDKERVHSLSKCQHAWHYRKIGGELASASSLSKEFYFYGVSLLPLGECQPGCHYKSWLFQARNHVRWREVVFMVGLASSDASRLLKNGSG